MRYHFSGKDDEANSSSSAFTIWSTGNLQAPNILKTIQNPIGSEAACFTDELSSLYSLDVVSPSQKRKILDCEKGDFEERFRKIQRKKQLQKVAAKANLVVDDDDDESDEEDEIYEQMDWIEKENEALNMHSWESSDEDDEENDEDDSFEDIRPNTSVLFISRSKWKEERRRLLRISMAKIRRVEDPEAYLRRSVLINNTVKRLQKDVSMNLTCHSIASSSFIQGNVYQNESVNNWEVENTNASVICKPNHSEGSVFGVEYPSSILNSNPVVHFGDPSAHSDLPCNPVSLHLAFASTFSTDKVFDIPQSEILHNSTFNKTTLEEQRLSETPIAPVILKQPSTLHLFSSQPCGLQYRNLVQDEDCGDEYCESSNASSILDSVVYHSLVASLET